MNAGANTEARDRNNDTPLLLAAWLGHGAAVAKLLASGARVDAEGIPRSALHCACMQGHADCVSELLHGGADESAEDEDGNTPLQVIGAMSDSLERAENIVVIHAMLRRAPADRTWRRRGWLILLRARDCAAAVLLPPIPSPLAVVTRGAAARQRDVAGRADASGNGCIQRPLVVPLIASIRSTRKPSGRSQTKKEVGTRGSRDGRAVGHVEGKMPKRMPVGGGVVAAVARAAAAAAAGGEEAGVNSWTEGTGGTLRRCGNRSLPKKILERKGGTAEKADKPVGTKRMRRRIDSDDADRNALTNIVAQLISLGEEGAFRCVLSFL